MVDVCRQIGVVEVTGKTDRAGDRSKKAYMDAKRRELEAWLQERFKVNARRVGPIGVAETLRLVLEERGAPRSAPARLRIREIATDRPRFGYLRALVMLKREGCRLARSGAIGRIGWKGWKGCSVE